MLRFYCALLALLLGIEAPDCSASGLNSMQEIRANGWPVQLRDLPVARDKSYAVWIFAPPSVSLNLTSPENFRRSIRSLENRLDSVDVGHSLLAWQCRTNWGTTRGIAAQSGEKKNQIREMLGDGWGVTPFLSTFQDGFIEGAERIEAHTLPRFAADGRLRYLVIELKDEECRSVFDYLTEFLEGAEKSASRYSIAVGLGQVSGGGCLGFVLAALARTEFGRQVGPLLLRELRMPERLLGCGDPSRYADTQAPSYCDGTRGRLDNFNLFTQNWDIRSGEATRELRLYDPALVEYLFGYLAGRALPYDRRHDGERILQLAETLKPYLNLRYSVESSLGKGVMILRR